MIDLSRLPAPAVVAPVSYEAERAALIADFRTRWPGFDALLESDPVLKLIETVAYQNTLLRAALNDAARGVMLAFATGGDLDQLAAFYGLARLILTPATDTAPAVMESDGDFRTRIQLAPEAWAEAGITGGGYRARVMTAFPAIRDVTVIKRTGGQIDLVLLGRTADGAVAGETVSAVADLFAGEDVAQLTDIVSVRSAVPVAYHPTVTLRIRYGPDPALIRTAAEAGIRAYAVQRQRVGATVYAQQLAAAASVGGVEEAIVDIADVVPAPAQVPVLGTLTLAHQVVA